MAIYAQHGYGKGNKISRGLQLGSLGGVIFSPRDETPANLRQSISAVRNDFSDAQILIDPQFYATTIMPVRDGKLPNYSYYRSGLTRGSFISATNISGYVKDTLDYQIQLLVSNLVAPTVLFDDFQDPWSHIALSIAHESVQYHSNLTEAPPLLLSLAFSETALRSQDSMEQFLDILSLFEVSGFYIIVKRGDTQYKPQMEQQILENLLYLTYTLAEVNNYEVILGYTDIIGSLFHAIGVKATACGWHQSLRQFSLSRFQPPTGGRRPRERYTSIPLLNSILVVPELTTIYNLGIVNEVLTDTSLDHSFQTDPGNVSWPLELSSLHHWEALHQVTQDIMTQGSIGNRLSYILRKIEEAKALYSTLTSRGVIFTPQSGSTHLDEWKRAIERFRSSTGV